MTTLNIQGREVEVSDDFLALTPEQQNETVEEIARQMDIRPQKDERDVFGLPMRSPESPTGRFLGQINRNIAEGVGGIVNFVNPFDVPTQLLGFEMPVTGSAVEGINALNLSIDAAVAAGPPEGVVEAMGAGVGAAAAALIPVAKGLQALKGVGGAVGAFANDAVRALATVPGFVAEVGAGATGRAAREGAVAAGAPQVVQDVAEIAGGLGVPVVAATARVAGQAAMRIPGVAPLVEAVAPMTAAGAREVAGRRARDLVGGRERAEELAGQLDPDDLLGLTPAEQLADPNLLGLQRAAIAEDPLLRERLIERAARSRVEAKTAITEITDGDPALKGTVVDARDFFTERLATFMGNMGVRVRRAVSGADVKIKATGPRLTETESSARMVARVKDSLADDLIEEKRLHDKVPRGILTSSQKARDTVTEFAATLSPAELEDIPARAIKFLGLQVSSEGVVSIKGPGAKNVGDMLGLYSKLRAGARNDLAGNITERNRARVGNAIADAILVDLGTVNPDTPVGVAINNARAFSRALHETFDQGAVGRILRRSVQADETIPAGVALKKTVGVEGAGAKIAAQEIRRAAADTELDIADFLRRKFTRAVNLTGDNFTPKTAKTFLVNNEELLRDFPELSAEFNKALGSRNAAAMFETRAAARTKLVEDTSAIARFKLGQEEKAVLSIIGADDPAKTAKSIMATARKDGSGLAIRGVKNAFKEYLIAGGTKGGDLSGRQLSALMSDKNTRAALNQVFSAEEMRSLKRVATELAKVDPTNVKDVGAVMEGPANQIIEIVARISGAMVGGEMGGGSLGGSLQAAQIVSARARALMRRMTNTRARQLLMDSVESSVLMKVLLTAPEAIVRSPAVRARLAPYLIGTAATVVGSGEE